MWEDGKVGDMRRRLSAGVAVGSARTEAGAASLRDTVEANLQETRGEGGGGRRRERGCPVPIQNIGDVLGKGHLKCERAQRAKNPASHAAGLKEGSSDIEVRVNNRPVAHRSIHVHSTLTT